MSNKNQEAVKITKTSLEEFKKLVRRAIMLTGNEDSLFNAIPNDNWERIFSRNFNGNFEYARRVLLNKYKEIEKIDSVNTLREHKKISNLDKATKLFIESVEKEIPIIFVTDFDNDGSLAQAIINEYREMDPIANKNIIVEYAQTVNGNSSRGFTVDHIDLIMEMKELEANKEFLIVTADNGINSVDEQKKIMEKYPFAKLIVTDHHNPEPDMVVQEDDRTIIFNPHYKPTAFFQKFNISGAATVGVLLDEVLDRRLTEKEKLEFEKNYEKLDTLYKVSNLLDYVDTHPADKPEKDYIITKFLRLQPLLNINNSISKIITGEIPVSAIAALEKKIVNLNVDLLFAEAKNIHTQNHVAKILLKVNNLYQKQVESHKLGIGAKPNHDKEGFVDLFMHELTLSENFIESRPINPNYIEQLRPLIFSLSADFENDEFMNALNEKMVGVFESVRVSEKKMAEELRKGEVITKSRMSHSLIAYADPNILTIFNRKFLNKVYNDENPGFALTLDSIGKGKVSGSFRSLYDISDILKDKKKLEKKLNVRIDTPGHERAAGFIIRSNDPEKNPITEKTIEIINKHINDSIIQLKKQEVKDMKTYLLTDMTSIPLIDRINTVIRGNVSNFERITPVLRLSKDTVWTDSYTTKQYTMEQICENRQYGYITVNINFAGNTVIIPVELVRKVVESNYENYLSLSYMDGGVFMVERALPKEEVRKIVDLRDASEKTKALIEAYEQDFSNGNHVVPLTREQIKDNPFFKYNDYGQLDFNLFESMIIGIIDSNEVDTLSVLDVEANGFGNSKLMNIGFMNYFIDESTGIEMDVEEFEKRVFMTQRGEKYLLEDGEIIQLKKINSDEMRELPLETQKKVLINMANLTNKEVNYDYYLASDNILNIKKGLPYLPITNYNFSQNRKMIYNRQIKGEMLAYLIKDKDFLVPQEMVNLTGITQELLNKYGVETDQADTEIAEYYKNKRVLFGAHNTPYDARVARANLKKTYEILDNSGIYDSALFCREQKLAYDSVQVSSFDGVVGMPKNIYFYDNQFSDFNLQKFILEKKNGYYPDRTNRYLLEIDNEQFILVDKQEHTKVVLDANQQHMLECLGNSSIPNNSVKYSVEKLSEQMMVHSLLLTDEKFNIQLVDLFKPEFNSLIDYADDLKFFQENYHFDNDILSNLINFVRMSAVEIDPYMVSFLMPKWELDKNTNQAVLKAPRLESLEEDIIKNLPEGATKEEIDAAYEEYMEVYPEMQKSLQMAKFIHNFMESNKDIQQKFADSWMYKQVLSIKDPSQNEVNNDLIDLVNYQTAIPKEKIRKIYTDAIKFKKKYGVDHVLQHEMHANGPWRTDAKGDINFEDKLTLLLLANRNYDSYKHDVNKAVKMFNEFRVRAQSAFKIADKLSDDTAQDSYSFRQAILYDRDDETLSVMIQGLQEKEARLMKTEGARLVKFKLDNDVLPQASCVYGVVKKDIQLNREQIEEHKKKIGFIILNKQITNSLTSMPGSLAKKVQEIVEANNEKMETYSKELMEVYSYVEYDRKDYQIKQIIDKAKGILFDKEKISARMKLNTENIDVKGYEIIKYVIEDIQNNCLNLGVYSSNTNAISELMDKAFNESYSNGTKKTEVEIALEGTQNDEYQQPKVFDYGVSINRQAPIKRLLDSHPEYRLINNYIEIRKDEFLPMKKRKKSV